MWDALSFAEQARLARRLYGIFQRTYRGPSFGEFRAFFLDQPEVVVALFRGASGELGGFCTARLIPVKNSRVEVVAYSGGVYFNPRYSGGAWAMGFALGEALRYQLRHPTARLGYFAAVHTPAPYRLNTATMPRVYPSRPERSGEAPPEVLDIIGELTRARGWAQVGDDPCVFQSPFVPRAADWLASSSLREDPDAAYFLDRVPGWSRGHALMIWVPLRPWDLAGAAKRRFLGRLRR